jgi:hypothetical protein
MQEFHLWHRLSGDESWTVKEVRRRVSRQEQSCTREKPAKSP